MKRIVTIFALGIVALSSCQKTKLLELNKTATVQILGQDLTNTACSGGRWIQLNGTNIRTYTDIGKINGIFNVADFAFPVTAKIIYKEIITPNCGTEIEILNIEL